MNKRIYYFLLAILLLVVGVLVYYYFKKDTLVYESYLGIHKAAPAADTAGNKAASAAANWLPDLLWEISFLFMLTAVWGSWNLVPKLIKLFTFIVIIGTELLQMLGILPGTGDIIDILVYFIGFSIFTLLFTERSKKSL